MKGFLKYKKASGASDVYQRDLKYRTRSFVKFHSESVASLSAEVMSVYFSELRFEPAAPSRAAGKRNALAIYRSAMLDIEPDLLALSGPQTGSKSGSFLGNSGRAASLTADEFR